MLSLLYNDIYTIQYFLWKASLLQIIAATAHNVVMLSIIWLMATNTVAVIMVLIVVLIANRKGNSIHFLRNV